MLLELKAIDADRKIERLDLRDKLIVTIDGADAKDLDEPDRVSKSRMETTTSAFTLPMSSHYVRPNTRLDEAAYERATATSVYLADRVIHAAPLSFRTTCVRSIRMKRRPRFPVEWSSTRRVKSSRMRSTRTLIESKVRLELQGSQ